MFDRSLGAGYHRANQEATVAAYLTCVRRRPTSTALARSALTIRRESLPLDDDLPVRIDSVVPLHDQRERATGRPAHEPEHLSVRADEAHGRLAERAVILPLHPELLTALGSRAP